MEAVRPEDRHTDTAYFLAGRGGGAGGERRSTHMCKVGVSNRCWVGWCLPVGKQDKKCAKGGGGGQHDPVVLG